MIVPSLTLRSSRTYVWAGVFVAGNLLFPQLCHLLGTGGPVLLPILFFTLIAAVRFGPVCGMVTALLSPLANHLLFGMPETAMLPVLLAESVAMVLAFAWFSGRLSPVWTFAATVLAYQGTALAMLVLLTGSLSAASGSVLATWPAVLLQAGGYALACRPARRERA